MIRQTLSNHIWDNKNDSINKLNKSEEKHSLSYKVHIITTNEIL